MSFTGFSSDDEGSIVYDGKKFIVTNPRQVPDDFNPGDKEVVGLPENHPSHPKNRQPSPIPKYVPPAVIYTAFDKHRAEEHQKRVQKAGDSGKPKEKEKPAQEVAQPTLPPDYVGDIPESPLVFEQSWTKKLSEGQKLQIDYLLSTEGEPLVSDMLLALKYEGMPEWISFDDFMKRFAEWGWDEEADQRAREIWQSIMQDQTNDSIGSLPVFGDGWYQRIEETLAGQANDTIESLQVIDAATGQVLLNRIGVLGGAGQQYVGLQKEDIRPFQDHDLIFVHNHPNGTAASETDLRTAFLAGAEMLLVVTPRGYEYVYIRGESGMAPVHEGEASYEVTPATAAEYVELEGRSWQQAQMDRRNLPVMYQGEPNWWERENIIVTYETTETIEEVADRMGIPKEHLHKLNEGSTDTGIINIPLPGWYLDNRNMYRIAALDGRTLLYYADNVVTQWQELSPTEQKIEMALTATANAGAGEANFDNIQSFDSALDWITHNKELINIYADNARVPEEILRVILTSEILYDYGELDAWQDAAVRHNIPLSIDIGWQATGVANVHYATLIEAYHYIASRLPESVEHPWDLDPNAPDLSGFPTLDLDEQTEQEPEESPTGERDAEIFRQRETRYGELTYDQKKAVAIYLVTNEGTINAASMVTRMYLDQYITQKWEDPQNFAEIAENLSPKDVARIWGRYRSAYEPLDAAVFGPNAQLARPIAEYLLG